MMAEHQIIVLKQLSRDMADWTEAQRVEFLAELLAEFCEHCGRRHPIGLCCQCENDE